MHSSKFFYLGAVVALCATLGQSSGPVYMCPSGDEPETAKSMYWGYSGAQLSDGCNFDSGSWDWAFELGGTKISPPQDRLRISLTDLVVPHNIVIQGSALVTVPMFFTLANSTFSQTNPSNVPQLNFKGVFPAGSHITVSSVTVDVENLAACVVCFTLVTTDELVADISNVVLTLNSNAAKNNQYTPRTLSLVGFSGAIGNMTNTGFDVENCVLNIGDKDVTATIVDPRLATQVNHVDDDSNSVTTSVATSGSSSAAGTPAAGTPAAGTPAAGTPGAGTPGAGTPGAGTTVSAPTIEVAAQRNTLRAARTTGVPELSCTPDAPIQSMWSGKSGAILSAGCYFSELTWAWTFSLGAAKVDTAVQDTIDIFLSDLVIPLGLNIQGGAAELPVDFRLIDSQFKVVNKYRPLNLKFTGSLPAGSSITVLGVTIKGAEPQLCVFCLDGIDTSALAVLVQDAQFSLNLEGLLSAPKEGGVMNLVGITANSNASSSTISVIECTLDVGHMQPTAAVIDPNFRAKGFIVTNTDNTLTQLQPGDPIPLPPPVVKLPPTYDDLQFVTIAEKKLITQDILGFLPNYDNIAYMTQAAFEKYFQKGVTVLMIFAYTFAPYGGDLASLNNPFKNNKALRNLRAAAYKYNGKVVASIGGASGSEALRTRFNATLIDETVNYFVDQYHRHGYDGFDLDYEFPETEQEWTDARSFISKMRSRLGPNAWLSMDIRCPYLKEEFDQLKAHDFITDLTAFNPMCYDMLSPSGIYAVHHSPIYILEDFKKYIPTHFKNLSSKFNVGVPFYGRQPADHGWVAPFSSVPTTDDINKDFHGEHYYNGYKTLEAKAQMAALDFGGVMIWELRQDSKDISRSLMKPLVLGLLSVAKDSAAARANIDVAKVREAAELEEVKLLNPGLFEGAPVPRVAVADPPADAQAQAQTGTQTGAQVQTVAHAPAPIVGYFQATPEQLQNIKKPVVAFLPTYRGMATKSLAQYKEIFASGVSVLVMFTYSFTQRKDDLATVDTFKASFPHARQAANDYGAKVVASIGGDGLSYTLHTMFSAAHVDATVQRLKDEADFWGFDGYDIDYEFPRTPEEWADAKTFVTKLRAALGASAWISMDIRCPYHYEEWTGMADNDFLGVIDYFNAMCYDMNSPSGIYATEHSPLYIVEDLKNHINQHFPGKMERFTVGVPFYGWDANRALIPQRWADIPATDDPKVDFHLGRYFNGKDTIQKKALLAAKEFGGLMIWEIGQESNRAGFSLMESVVKGMNLEEVA